MRKLSNLKTLLLAFALLTGMKSVNAATFTSIANGSWNVAGTWDQGVAIPTSTDDIVIASGHSITLNASSNCNNLTINSAGFLSIAGKILTTTGNVNIYGTLKGSPNANSSFGTWTLSGSGPTVTIDGTLGGTGTSVTTGTGEGVKIVLGFATNTTATFQGSGIVNISHFYSSNIVANQNTIIDINMNIKNVFPTTTNVPFGLQNGNNGTNSTKVITINSGKTIILNNQYSFFHSLTSSGSGNTGGTMTYNINGTLDVRAGQFNLSTNTNSTSNLVTVNVGASGKLILGSTVCLNTNLLGQIPPSIALNSGSSIEFAGNISPTIIASAASGATPPTFPWNNLSNLIINNSAGVTLSSNTNSETLAINSGSILSVNPAKQLTVSTALINNGTLNLLSTVADGTATILTLATMSGSGTTNVQQYLTGGTGLTDRQWWYVSSPVSNATSSVFTPSGANNFGYYNEAITDYVQIPGDAEPLLVGHGYVSQLKSTDTFVFSGTLNNGDIPVAVTRTGTTAGKRGFNLVGNPYPSYLNWGSADIVKTNVRSTIWYRTFSGTNMIFLTNDGTFGTGTSSAYIPPMQAFWVRVDADNIPATLKFVNLARSHQDQSVATNRLRAREVNTAQILRLKVSNGINNDEAIIVTDPNALDVFDNYDSQKMTNDNVNIPEIFTLAGSEELVINHVNNLSGNKELPLGFRPGKTSDFTIEATEVSDFGSDMKVMLLDKLKGTEQELAVGSPYSFSSDAIASNDRFSLMFKSTSIATGLNNATNNQNVLVYRNLNNHITVICNAVFDDQSSVSVYNAVGQKLSNQKLAKTSTEINGAFTAGVYLVTVHNGGQTVTKKVIIK